MTEGQSSILIVDDDKEDVSLVERALRSIGSEIFSIRDPHEVVPTVFQRRPDVVILDALLPGLSGFDLCKQIKSEPQLRGIQVLILTGVYLRQQYRNEAIQQFKADAFLTKPFRPPELQRVVAQLLSRRTRTPQSSFLKRIGLPIASQSRKQGFLGRLFGRGSASGVDESTPARTAPVSHEEKSESVPPAPEAEKKTESREPEPQPQEASESRKSSEPQRGLTESEQKASAAAPEPSDSVPASTSAEEPKPDEAASATAAPVDGPLAESKSMSKSESKSESESESESEPESEPEPQPEPEPELEPQPEPAREPQPAPAAPTSTTETKTPSGPVLTSSSEEPEAESSQRSPSHGIEVEPDENGAPAAVAEPSVPVVERPEEARPAPLKPPTAEPVPAEPTSPETIAISAQRPFAEPMTVRLEGEREEPEQRPESPEATIAMPPGSIAPAMERGVADSEATDARPESDEPAEVVGETARGNAGGSGYASERENVATEAEAVHEPSAAEELEAAPLVDSEKPSWMEAQARTQEMTVEEARSLAGNSHSSVAGTAPANEPIPASPPADADAPELTLENQRFLEALTSQDGPAAVKEPEEEPQPQLDRREGAPVSVEAKAPATAEQAEEEQRHPIRRPPARMGDVPIYEEEDFVTELKRELSKCKRVDRPLTLIMIRVGDLRQIVELFGKKYREAVLWHVAEQATASLREVDLVGMMSSNDRIAMTAFASDRYGGGRIVSRMRKAVEKNPFRVEGAIPPIIPMLDFGMATFPRDGDEVSCLIRKAEDELGAADRDESTTGVHPD